MNQTIVEAQVKDGGQDWRNGSMDADKWMNLFNWS